MIVWTKDELPPEGMLDGRYVLLLIQPDYGPQNPIPIVAKWVGVGWGMSHSTTLVTAKIIAWASLDET